MAQHLPERKPVELLIGDDHITQLLVDNGQLLALTDFGFILKYNDHDATWTQFPAPFSVNLARQLEARQEEDNGSQTT